jgi:CBS domain-containing protein
VPVVAAVLVALACRPYLIGVGPMFPFDPGPIGDLRIIGPLAVVLGVVVGLQATLLSNILYWVEDMFHRLPVHWMWWPAIGGVVVGLGGLIDAHVLGAGYADIQALLDGSLAVKVVIALALVKGVVWLVALGSGTSGGVLAPLLILGGALGYQCGIPLPGVPGYWAMLGMAAIMSGAMRAPLTGALFAVELTGQFQSLPLTIAASAAAYAVSVLLMRRSILTEKIARRGRHVLQEYSIDPLEFIQAAQVMTKSPDTLAGERTIGSVVAFFESEAKHRSYPVVDDAGRLQGLVSRSDALRWQGDDEIVDSSLADVLSDASQPLAYPGTPIGDVADLMVDTGVGRIPIVEPKTHRVVGILSRHDLLKARSAGQKTERIQARPA